MAQIVPLCADVGVGHCTGWFCGVSGHCAGGGGVVVGAGGVLGGDRQVSAGIGLAAGAGPDLAAGPVGSALAALPFLELLELQELLVLAELGVVLGAGRGPVLDHLGLDHLGWAGLLLLLVGVLRAGVAVRLVRVGHDTHDAVRGNRGHHRRSPPRLVRPRHDSGRGCAARSRRGAV
ncbi:hypothetical protein GCM10010470_51270 [Saccharopolyspora taberi]|uniref:Uncharacterized protein n=1 Tax=Saccharopolyspora taberi TaxID=60895 RepID=A0ABN3VIX0_9PSEU